MIMVHVEYEQCGELEDMRVIVQSPTPDSSTRELINEIQQLNRSPIFQMVKASVLGRTSLIRVRDILFINAKEKKVYVRYQQRDWMVKYTLKQLETLLPSRLFQRISKSEIINLTGIVRFDLSRDGAITALLRDGSTHHVSNSFMPVITERIIRS